MTINAREAPPFFRFGQQASLRSVTCMLPAFDHICFFLGCVDIANCSETCIGFLRTLECQAVILDVQLGDRHEASRCEFYAYILKLFICLPQRCLSERRHDLVTYDAGCQERISQLLKACSQASVGAATATANHTGPATICKLKTAQSQRADSIEKRWQHPEARLRTGLEAARLEAARLEAAQTRMHARKRARRDAYHNRIPLDLDALRPAIAESDGLKAMLADLPNSDLMIEIRSRAQIIRSSLTEHHVNGDGHCQFNSVLRQAPEYNLRGGFRELRIDAANVVVNHSEKWVPFFPRKGHRSSLQCLMAWADGIKLWRWGDAISLQGIVHILQRPAVVWHRGSSRPPIVVLPPFNRRKHLKKPIFLLRNALDPGSEHYSPLMPELSPTNVGADAALSVCGQLPKPADYVHVPNEELQNFFDIRSHEHICARKAN